MLDKSRIQLSKFNCFQFVKILNIQAFNLILYIHKIQLYIITTKKKKWPDNKKLVC